jgi:hypothetical protein
MPDTLYRAVKTLPATGQGEIHRWRPTVRLPSNVPYLVDNLWEFLRPQDMPCRRHAVYASPSPELALECAAHPDQRAAYTPYAVAIDGVYKVAQLDVEDARYHSDIRAVQRLAQQHQASWAGLRWETRLRLAMLFAPGCAKADWEQAMREDDVVSGVVSELRKASTFWSTAHAPLASSRGELFFELQDGASYQLRPLAGS